MRLGMNDYGKKVSRIANILVTGDKTGYRYGSIEAITEELGEVARADRESRITDTYGKLWSQDQLIEKLGDLLFNITLFSYYRRIGLEDILESNLELLDKRLSGKQSALYHKSHA